MALTIDLAAEQTAVLAAKARISRHLSPYRRPLRELAEALNGGRMAPEKSFEQGVLRPLEPIALPEHQHVRLTIEEKSTPLSWLSPEPVNE